MATFRLEPVYIRSHRDRVLAARERTQIAIDCGCVDPHPNNPRAVPGDPWRLRGIPVVGVHGGVGGAMAGSRP